MDVIQGRFKSGHAVTNVWHPEPDTDLITTSWGSARVLVGEPQYQLSTGEIVKF